MFLFEPILDIPGWQRLALFGACDMAGLLWAARTYRERSDR